MNLKKMISAGEKGGVKVKLEISLKESMEMLGVELEELEEMEYLRKGPL